MRKARLSLLITLLIAIWSCNSNEGTRIIERPIFSVRNSNTIEIDTVVLTDTATILHIKAFFRPHWWIKIISETYLRGDGEKYMITGSDGIELDKEFYMPASGEATFKLTFPPIPRSLKTIDFIEGDFDDSFKVYGIDLTGKKSYPDYNKGVPRSVRRAKYEDVTELTAPQMEIGKTTINVHLLGYEKGMGSKTVSIYVNSFFPSDQISYDAIIDEEKGVASFEFEQYGVNPIFIPSPSITGYIAPGDNVDIYVDMQENCRQNSPFHKTEDKKRSIYFTGKSAAINNALTYMDKEYVLDSFSPAFHKAIEGMDIESYIEYVMEKWHVIENNIKTSEMPDIAKELIELDVKSDITSAILMAPYHLEGAYRIKNNIPQNQRKTDYKVPTLTAEHFKVLKSLDFNNPMMIYTNSFGNIYPAILHRVKDLSIITDDKEGLLYDLQKCYMLPQKISNMEPLTDQEKSLLAAIDEPFYAQVCSALEKNIQAQMEAAKDKTGYTICEIPDVPNKELFDAIAAKYEGKVVLVDFWATWCSPCISSIKKLEPVKDSELKHDDLMFVYITGPSSPMVKWQTVIADVKGDHYRVSEEQWKYLSEQIGVQGIPSYAIIEKDGTYKLRNDLRDFNKMKSTLVELVK